MGFIESHSSLLTEYNKNSPSSIGGSMSQNKKIYLRKSVFYMIIGTVWPEMYEEM